jgi:hypothetical protein
MFVIFLYWVAFFTTETLFKERHSIYVRTVRYSGKENESEAKHAKESEHWLNQTSTSNRYAALLEEGSEAQQRKAGPENTPNILQSV